MGTVALLDVPRTELIEAQWSYHRRAADMGSNQSAHNRITHWQTGSFTLRPIQTFTDFAQSNLYEAFKFRLDPAQVAFDSGLWREVPMNTNFGIGPCDYFFDEIVPSEQAPTLFNMPVGTNLDNVGLFTAVLPKLTGIAQQVEQHDWSAMSSVNSYPQNQGYCLRFVLEGRSTYTRGRILTFFFGEYALALNTDGVAELWQTNDYTNYANVYQFRWSTPPVHDTFHRIIIFPHGRDKIEFLSDYEYYHTGLYSPLVAVGRIDTDSHGGLYQVPGGVTTDANGNTLITQPGEWGLTLSREFRILIQVSLLGFWNGFGAQGKAGMYDKSVAMEFAPTADITLAIDADLNSPNNNINFGLYDAVNQVPFIPDGTNQTPQFFFFMQGLGDYAEGFASSSTPELYGYTLDKGALFATTPYLNYPTFVQDVQIDHGDAPESERLTLHIDNSDNQVQNYTRRGNIPLTLYDDVTGVIFFDGTAYQTRSGEAPSQHARVLEIEARGRADDILFKRWTDPPDFSKDPSSNTGQPWFWMDTVIRCFAAAGVPPEEVFFENAFNDQTLQFESPANWNFRLWLDGGAGGAAGGDKVGDGHEGAGLQRWFPLPGTEVYHSIDYLIRQVLGWNWYRDLQNGVWRIYKRPSAIQLNTQNTIPKVGFLRNKLLANAFINDNGLPAYEHRLMAQETVRPVCTTIIPCSFMLVDPFSTRTDFTTGPQGLPNLLGANSGGGVNPDPVDPELQKKFRFVVYQWDNPNGYISPAHPNPDITSVDYMNKRRERWLYLPQAANQEAYTWMGRRAYETMCLGRVWRNWDAPWGDEFTAYLRKWDTVLLDSAPDGSLELWVLDRIEPYWTRGGSDRNRRARYRASLYRPDAPPPY